MTPPVSQDQRGKLRPRVGWGVALGGSSWPSQVAPRSSGSCVSFLVYWGLPVSQTSSLVPCNDQQPSSLDLPASLL